jgi:hypothetical protein
MFFTGRLAPFRFEFNAIGDKPEWEAHPTRGRPLKEPFIQQKTHPGSQVRLE